MEGRGVQWTPRVIMPTNVTNLLSNSYVLFFGKGAILILLVLYAIFALIIIRQVDLMGKTLKTSLAPVIKILAIIHAVFVIGLIFLALMIL